jgi:hypothetical protein
VGSAIITSIQTSVQDKDGPDGALKYKGRAAAFWFVLAVVCVETIALIVFYDPKIGVLGDEDRDVKGLPESESATVPASETASTNEKGASPEKTVAEDGTTKV